MQLCNRCKKYPVEDFGDDEPSFQCGYCNDREIERSNRAREWREFHDEPIPASELDP